MSAKGRVEQIVSHSIDEVNQHRTMDGLIGKGPEVQLFGEGGCLDSMGVISLLVMLEEEVEREFKAPLSLVEDETVVGSMDGEGSVRTVEDLVAHVTALIGGAADG